MDDIRHHVLWAALDRCADPNVRWVQLTWSSCFAAQAWEVCGTPDLFEYNDDVYEWFLKEVVDGNASLALHLTDGTRTLPQLFCEVAQLDPTGAHERSMATGFGRRRIPEDLDMVCIGCQRHPSEISEYIEAAEDDDPHGAGPARYVAVEEGTYNRRNGHFACTDCYIAMGMPTSPEGWKAP